MTDHITREEFQLMDARVRVLESEVVGEKAVTRHVLAQASHNADDLAELKTGVRHLSEQMVLANAAINSLGSRFTALAQDVTLLRGDVTALRRGQEEIHTRIDQMQVDLTRKLNVILSAVSPGAPPF